jgi:serine-type D-Ala-D-Ala carboxypeptidase/endopeptidase
MTTHRWLFASLSLATALAQPPKIGGDYSGMLGPLHIKLHLKTGATGNLEGTLDSVDQGGFGLACSNLHVNGNNFTFEVPSVNGKWQGTVSDNGATLNGAWSQGSPIPLVFRRDEPFAAAEKPSPVDGIWLGTLQAPGRSLRIQLQLKSAKGADARHQSVKELANPSGGARDTATVLREFPRRDRSGKEHCSFDSLDQGAMGLVCENVRLDGNHFSFEVPVVHGHWSGTLSATGNELDGTWSQGKDLPLRFTRQKTAVAAKPPEPPRFDPAQPPVPIADLKAVLDRDLAAALANGALAPNTNAGVAVGVEQHGTRRIFVYGPVKENSIFEIGSISKTFTSLILAQMVEQHKLTLDEPVRELLPPGTVAKPNGAEVTLLDLADQHSGLPRLPDNFHPADPENPYADYNAAKLYEYVAQHGLAKPAEARFNYSNLGLGLLGQALGNRAATTYPKLLQTEVAGPLQLHDTVVKLSPEQQQRFAQGHNAQHQRAHVWDLDALAGAGAIRSTAGDMLAYLAAQLHPESVSNASATLPAAIRLSHELRADVTPSMKIALAWFCDTNTGVYWHNGGTGGFSSYALFNPKEDYAAVVLYNTAGGPNGSFADRLAMHISARLSGKPALSLGP